MMSLKFAAIALLACLFVAAAFAQESQQRRPGGGGYGGGEEAYGDLSQFQSTTALSFITTSFWAVWPYSALCACA